MGLSEEERAELAGFAKWVLDVGDGVLPTKKRSDGDENLWVCISSRFLVMGKVERVAAIVEEI